MDPCVVCRASHGRAEVLHYAKGVWKGAVQFVIVFTVNKVDICSEADAFGTMEPTV